MPNRTQINSILVATGLGSESNAPLKVAGELAERSGAELHLVHALELQTVPATGGGEPLPSFRDLVEQVGTELEEEASRSIPADLTPTSSEVVIFVPHKAILNRALQVSADLIVLGAHRRRTTGDQLLGPTPDRVIRSAAAPCLIVPEFEPRPFRKIVAPIDLQMPAAAALDLAVVWASLFGDSDGIEIQTLYTVPPDWDPRGEAEWEAGLRDVIDGARARNSVNGNITFTPVIRRGNTPADAILHHLDEVDADLVALGTRGFGAIRRALIGSVASTVGRRAACPVLLVPPVLWRGAERG